MLPSSYGNQTRFTKRMLLGIFAQFPACDKCLEVAITKIKFVKQIGSAFKFFHGRRFSAVSVHCLQNIFSSAAGVFKGHLYANRIAEWSWSHRLLCPFLHHTVSKGIESFFCQSVCICLHIPLAYKRESAIIVIMRPTRFNYHDV